MPNCLLTSEDIGPSSNLEELIDRFPGTASVFVEHRMGCVGCEIARFETVAEACNIYRKPVEPLLADLRRAIGQRD